MDILIKCKTNYSVPWLNEMILKTADGKRIVIDRDRTEFWNDEEPGITNIIWHDIYRWDEVEEKEYELTEELFKGAAIEEIEVEDDAPKDYIFEPLDCHAFGFPHTKYDRCEERWCWWIELPLKEVKNVR